MSRNLSDSVFWIEVGKINPNPYQPRKEFDENALRALSESIRQYGVLQPLVVTRKEVEKEDGGITSTYELIAGERRLRASKLAGLEQVPVVIRTGEQSDEMKLELAIIENLQREDLNPIDRARAFARLSQKFGYTHAQIAKKVGKSRVYVSNSIRLLALPEYITQALQAGQIAEGHARPLLMLEDRPDEQNTLFKDIMLKRLSVRETERISRKIAVERVRKHTLDLEFVELEQELSDKLGTRVQIEKKQHGGKVVIDFFSSEDLRNLLQKVGEVEEGKLSSAKAVLDVIDNENEPEALNAEKNTEMNDVPEAEEKENEEDPDLYSVTNFTV